MPRCRARNQDGQPCRSPEHLVDPEVGYCSVHAPGGHERMSEIGRKGAEAAARKLRRAAGLEPGELPELGTPPTTRRGRSTSWPTLRGGPAPAATGGRDNPGGSGVAPGARGGRGDGPGGGAEGGDRQAQGRAQAQAGEVSPRAGCTGVLLSPRGSSGGVDPSASLCLFPQVRKGGVRSRGRPVSPLTHKPHAGVRF